MISLLPSNYYHIYNHAIGDEHIFRNDDNYRFFLDKYAKYICPITETLAYSLLPDHFHLLVKIKGEEALLQRAFPKYRTLEELLAGKYISKQFSNLFSSYAQSYNKMFERIGSLFIKNFRRRPVLILSSLPKLIQYIHADPVRHGFARKIEDWRWSSYSGFLSESPTTLNREEILDWFGGKKGFVKFHQRPIYLNTTDMFER